MVREISSYDFLFMSASCVIWNKNTGKIKFTFGNNVFSKETTTSWSEKIENGDFTFKKSGGEDQSIMEV